MKHQGIHQMRRWPDQKHEVVWGGSCAEWEDHTPTWEAASMSLLLNRCLDGRLLE